MANKAKNLLVEAEDLLDAVLDDAYEGDDWVAIDKAHQSIEDAIDELS